MSAAATTSSPDVRKRAQDAVRSKIVHDMQPFLPGSKFFNICSGVGLHDRDLPPEKDDEYWWRGPSRTVDAPAPEGSTVTFWKLYVREGPEKDEVTRVLGANTTYLQYYMKCLAVIMGNLREALDALGRLAEHTLHTRDVHVYVTVEATDTTTSMTMHLRAPGTPPPSL